MSSDKYKFTMLKIIGRVGFPAVARLFYRSKLPALGHPLLRVDRRVYYPEQEIVLYNDNIGRDIGTHLTNAIPSYVANNRAMGRTFWALAWRAEYERDERLRGLGMDRVIQR